jgi:hypothetical protein
MRYYMHDGPAAFRFELAGDLDTNDATRLEQEWRTASSIMGKRTLIIDLSFVTGIDEEVLSLFRRWYAEGAEFAANSRRSRDLVESITERPFVRELPHAPTHRSWFSRISASLISILAIALIPPTALHAAELKPETLSAWNQYVQSADAAMQARLRPGNPFLWVDEAPERRRQLRAGEILVTSVREQNPKQVPSGLIHHWIGAAFFPNANLDDVLGVVRNYERYKDYYNPTVVDSRTIRQAPQADRFSTVLMNKALFLKIAIENECESSYVQTGPGRWYSIATTVRVQEIEDYGQLSERKLPLGEGGGYIWGLQTITRYEEADGGTYVEVEAMALSRDIPSAVRWMVDPIVRRISKEAMVTSLRQTQAAVGSSGQAAAGRSVTIPRLASGLLQSSSQH